jgi:MFS family permease
LRRAIRSEASGHQPSTAAVVGVPLAALAAGTFATVAIGALAPELRADLGFSRTEIGLLTALVFVGASLASPRAGALTDTYGPVRMLGASLGIFALAVAAAALSPGAAAFMAAMAVGGIAYGGLNPATNVVIAGRLSSRLGFFMSLKQTGVPIGGFFAGVVLPPLALALSWRYAFGLAALVAAAVSFSSLLLRGAAVLRAPGEGRAPDARRSRDLIVTGAYGFIMAGGQWCFLTYVVLYLTEGRGWSLETAGLLLALATVSSVAGRLFWGWLSDRAGWRIHVLLLTSAIAAIMLALLALEVPRAAVWPVAAITGVALIGWNGAFHAVVADRAGPGGLGRASGQVIALVFAGSVVLPPLFGLLSESLDSWRALWALTAITVAAGGVLLFAGLREQRPASDVSIREAD